jgi:hypothetical protein
MEQVQNPIVTTLITSELPFELVPEVKHWFEGELDEVSKLDTVIECLVIFPDKFIDRKSLLSCVMFSRVGKQCWEIRDISIYQVIEKGQSTELTGIIDGESSEFDRIEDGFLREDILSRWQESLVNDIKYQQVTDDQSFNSQHLKLLRSTGHEVIADFEEQKPHLCEA